MTPTEQLLKLAATLPEDRRQALLRGLKQIESIQGLNGRQLLSLKKMETIFEDDRHIADIAKDDL